MNVRIYMYISNYQTYIPLGDTFGFKSLSALAKLRVHCFSRDLGQTTNKDFAESFLILLLHTA